MGDNLFLNCILALNPDTGELVWYYQTVPGDTWDYTSTMTMTLVDVVIDGEDRQVLTQAPKNGFFYVLDRITGELISAEPITEHINWASGIDMETGRPIENPEARFDENGAWVSPSQGGAHNWQPMSYHPGTGLIYLAGRNTRSFYRLDLDYEPELGSFSTGTARGRPDESPPPLEPSDFLLAWDPATNQEGWRIPSDQRAIGTMTSGDNLLFTGWADGRLSARNAATGDLLWEAEIGPSPVSPITYEVDGRQYVSIMTGSQGGGAVPARVWTFTLDGNAAPPNQP
jgi:glucose dehydrogenase